MKQLINDAILIMLLSYPGWNQSAAVDTLNIHYRLLYSQFGENEVILKIKIPPYLNTREVMEQVKLAVQWPDDPPPLKITKVYVFKEDAKAGDTSATGGVYIPGRGFLWSMGNWEDDESINTYKPSLLDKIIHNTILDSVFEARMSLSDFEKRNNRVKQNIADWFGITVSELDSIYYRVKWWNELKRKH